ALRLGRGHGADRTAATAACHGKITKIDDKGVTLVVDKNDATGKTYTFAKDCKFSQMVKKTKQDIKDGVKADIFQKLPKKGLAVTLVTAEDGKVTEVIVGKKAKAVN
ncbi:MAG: hypothetical protein HYR84_10830, partial [Planctomycetes bacterium]|nr:hypothetical protein [Planctomycetota bacterium]